MIEKSGTQCYIIIGVLYINICCSLYLDFIH